MEINVCKTLPTRSPVELEDNKNVENMTQMQTPTISDW